MALKHLGVPRGKVKLTPYRKEWKKLFNTEKRRLKKIGQVEHIGSTAVPGLPAKPIIDMALGLTRVGKKDIEDLKKPLLQLDYVYIREDRPNEYLFIKGPEKNRTHHLHVIKYNGRAWKNYLSFRNHLLASPQDRQKYADLKKQLHNKFANNRKSYTEGKQKLVRYFIKKSNGR